MYLESVLTLLALNVTLPIYFIGQTGHASITVEGLREPNLAVDFGDGHVCNSKINSSLFHFTKLSDSPHPVIDIVIAHTYAFPGTFKVTVNVHGNDSWQICSVATVVEKISGVQLFLISSPVVALFDDVVVQASFETGSNLTFVWDFGDGSGGQYTTVQNFNKSSVAHHSYGVSEEYEISVSISSPYQQTIRVPLNQTVSAIELIEQLQLQILWSRFAVPLLEDVPDTNSSVSTKLILFEAHLWRGSNVQFLFDFGDGYQQEVPAFLDVWSAPRGRAKHSYSSGGVYAISVTATNPLSSATKSLTRPLIVQYLPQGLTLDQSYYTILRNTELHLHASVTAGTNVSFDWMIGEQHFGSSAGDIVIPFLDVGTYAVTVEAYNIVTDEAFDAVTRPSTSVKVFVQEPLQDVELCIITGEEKLCNISSLDLPLDHEITYEVRVRPAMKSSLRYIWNVGLGDFRRSSHSFFKLRYRDPGWYDVNVTVQNYISSISSTILKLHLIQKLCNLTAIHSQGPNLINQPITYNTFYWFGTDLMFEWHFGDGSPSFTSNSSTVKHTYTSIGEYEVSVHAWNKFSRANITTTMFVLDHACMKPELAFMNHHTDISVFHSEEIFFEVRLITSCQSIDVEYEWSLQDLSNHSPLQILDKDKLCQHQLLLPPYLVPPGHYIVQLKVRMVGTIVYNIVRTNLLVVKKLPKVVLKGSFVRSINRNNVINLVAEFVPFENSSAYDFHWSCSPLVEEQVPCFSNKTFLAHHNKSSFQLPSLSLNPDLQSVVIDVFASGPENSSASQVLDISAISNNLMISVECEECRSHTAALEQKLVFQAKCENCDKSENLLFNWVVWLIQDGMQNFDFGSTECVLADGSTFYIMGPNATEESHINTTSSSVFAVEDVSNGSNNAYFDDLPPFPKLPGFLEDNDVKDVRTRRQIRPQWFNMPLRGASDHLLDNLVLEGEAHFDDNLSLPHGFIDEDLDGLHHPYGPHFPIEEEGLPGESGSAAARDLGQNHFEILLSNDISDNEISEGATNGRKDLPKVHSNTESLPENDLPGDAVKDGSAKQTVPHIVRRPKIPLLIKSEDTTTGLQSEYFILKPGILRAAHSYMIEVNAYTKGEVELKGSAAEYVKMDVSPNHGRCTLMPTKAYSLDFVFRLHCFEWKSDYLPIFYELTYSMEPGGDEYLIYFGLNQNVKFVLPQGNPVDNYYVYLNVVVRDHRGSSTRVCSLIREVWPKNLTVDIEHYIYNKTFHPKSMLKKLLGEKQNQAALHKIQVFVTTLNILHEEIANHTHSVNGIKTRKMLRRHFLETFDGLSIFNKAEAAQIIRVIGDIVKLPSELDAIHLNLCVRLLSKLFSKKSEFGGAYLSKKLNHQVISTLSILAKTADHMITEGKSELLEVLYFAKSALLTEVKAALKERLTCEEAIQIERPCISFSAAYVRSDSVNDSTILTKHTKTTFSKNIFSSLKNALREDLRDLSRCKGIVCESQKETCFAVIVEESSLLSHENFHNQASNTENLVVTHKFFTCGGFLEVNVDAVQENSFTTHFENDHFVKPNETFHVSSLYMNVHTMNVTQSLTAKSLHFYVEFLPMSETPSFSVTALFSFRKIPDLGSYLFKFNWDEDRSSFHVVIPADVIKNPGVYYFALLNSDIFNGFTQKKSEKKMAYELSAVVHSCIQKIGDIWTEDGCSTVLKFSNHSVMCKCHSLLGISLSSTGLLTEFSLIPNDDLFEHYVNPVAIIFLLCIFIVYFFLLFTNHLSDRSHRMCLSPIPVKDYDANHPYKFLVTICTGSYRSAGTTSSVYIVLHGNIDITVTKQLIGVDESSHFHRGSEVTFLISLLHPLGHLKMVEVWHNNSGSSPSWYLSEIRVKDCFSGLSYIFPCRDWLSVTKGDCRIERVLQVVDKKSVHYRKLLWEYVVICLCKISIWNALTCNGPTSLFSGVQRLTCCLCFGLVSSSLLALSLCSLYPGDLSLAYISSNMLILSFIVAALSSCAQLFPALLFSISKPPSWGIFSAVGVLLKSVSLENVYCWLQGKYSFRGSSPTDSQLTYGESDSLFSSYFGSQVSSSSAEVFFDEDIINEECPLPSHLEVNHMESSSELTHLDHVLITWHAIEKWSKGRQRSISDSHDKEQPGSLDAYIESFQRKVLENYKSVAHSANESESFESSGIGVNEDGCDSTELKRTKKLLPLFFHYVAWSFLFLQIIAAVYFIITSTARMGLMHSLQWLKAVFVSVLFSSLLLYPLLAFVSAVVLATIRYWLKRRSDTSSCTNTLYNIDCGNPDERLISRRWLYFMNYLRPPVESTLIELHGRFLRQKFIYAFLCKSSLNLVLFLLLSIMAFGFNSNLNSNYRQKVSIEKAFIRSPIKTIDSLWHWLSVDVTDAYYGNQQCFKRNGDCGIVTTLGCYPVSEISLRKHDTSFKPCQKSVAYHPLHKCHEHSSQSYNSDDAGFLWENEEGLPKVVDEVILNTSSFDAISQLQSLKSIGWFNKDTTALSIEMVLFNPAISTLFYISLTAEMRFHQEFSLHSTILPLYLHHHWNRSYYMYITIEAIFLVVILIRTKMKLWQMFKSRATFWKSPSNYLEVLFILVSFLYLSFSVVYFLDVIQVSDYIQSHHIDTSARIKSAALLEAITRNLLGLVFFLQLVRCTDFLKLNPRLFAFLRVLKISWKILPFCGYILLFVVFAGHFLADVLSESYGMRRCLRAVNLLLQPYESPEISNVSSWFKTILFGLLLFTMMSFNFALIALMQAALIAVKGRNQWYKGHSFRLKEAFKVISNKLVNNFKPVQGHPVRKDHSYLSMELLLQQLELMAEKLLVKTDEMCREYQVPILDEDGCPESLQSTNEVSCFSANMTLDSETSLSGILDNLCCIESSSSIHVTEESLSASDNSVVINLPIEKPYCRSNNSFRKSLPDLLNGERATNIRKTLSLCPMDAVSSGNSNFAKAN